MISDYENLCETIFEIDPKIRYVAIYHKSGHKLCGGIRADLDPLLPSEEITKSAMHSIMRWETRGALATFIGQGKYSLAEYEKIKRMTFPLNQAELLLVSTEIDVNHDLIISKILDVLQKI
ncbi:MAG: hypothetical protein FJ357_00350 [Thaumarchaeota archaeon]|nr:hypothetical protein [Nitrososphaerota archaeon]